MFGGMPMPLSATVNRQNGPSRSAETCTSGVVPGAWKVMALRIRLANTWVSWVASTVTTGSVVSIRTLAPVAPIRASRSASTVSMTCRRSTGVSRWARVVRRL